jgi:TonB family protein
MKLGGWFHRRCGGWCSRRWWATLRLVELGLFGHQSVLIFLVVGLLAGCAIKTEPRGAVASDEPGAIPFTMMCGTLTGPTATPADSPKPPSIWRQGAWPVVADQASDRAYVKAVMDRIRANWMYPKSAGERNIEGEALIEFHIAKDGMIKYVGLRRSSGTQILDDAALVAVKLSQPFSPVPDSLCKNTLSMTGTFRYEIKRK